MPLIQAAISGRVKKTTPAWGSLLLRTAIRPSGRGATSTQLPPEVLKLDLRARTQQTTVMTNPHEHRDHQWLPPTKVTDLLFWHSNRDTWKLIDDYHQLTR